MKEKKYAFVEDIRGLKLSPTREEKAWYKVRKGKAKIVQVNPLVIQLQYEAENTDTSKIHMGLDPGETTGIGIVQECKTRNKVIFKGEILHRKDVSKLMTDRKGYRKYRRSEKRHRQARYNNRGSSKKEGRLAPSIKIRQDEITRVVKRLQKYIHIDKVVIEDVSFDIRAMTDSYKPYKWGYQRSNRLDENIRKATLMRDKYTCQECGKTDCMLEAHHIVPKRFNGSDTIGNIITLCTRCHKKVTEHEEEYIAKFQYITGDKQVGLRYASHVMLGKTYLRNELGKITAVELTDGGTTANRRIDWEIEKSHANDGIVITGIKPESIDVYEYKIKPLRKKRKCKIDTTLEVVQGDQVYYVRNNQNKIECYVTAILQSGHRKGCYNLKDYSGKRYGPVSLKSIKKISSKKGISII